VSVLVVRSEEELKERLNSGWRLHRCGEGFMLYDPGTKSKERVDKSLRHLCEYLYSKVGKAVERRGRATAKREVSVEEAERRVLEEDTRLILNAIKQRLDPKAPILSKWVENISYWHHVILDTSTYLLADLLSMLGEGEIDLSNPEVMVKNMVAKFKLLKTRALKAEELEAKHRSEVEILKQRISDLESQIKQYHEIIAEQNKIIDDLADKIKKTIYFFTVYVPNYLPEDARLAYRVLTRKVAEIWSESSEKK
jgi:hypothetical protein